MTPSETAILLEDWLRNSPDLSFKRVRADARKMHLLVTPRQFADVKRRLGITSGPPRSATPRVVVRAVSKQSAEVVGKTPLMKFGLDFLRGKPDATYHEFRSAGEAASFRITPINYGKARKMLGLAPKTKRVPGGGAMSGRSRAEPATHPATNPRQSVGRDRRRRVDLTNLSNLVGELEAIVAERDRLRAALEEIRTLIREL